MPRPGRAREAAASALARRATASALALLLGVAGTAAAQYNKTEPPITRFHAGPIRFNPKLELRNAGKDTNAVLAPINPVEDNSIVVRGTLTGFMPIRSRLRLYGEGWLDWSYFQSFSTESSWDPGGQGHAELDFGPLTVQGGGGAFQARQLYSIDIDQRILRQERWVNGGLEWRLTRRLVFSGGAEHHEYRFDPTAGTGQATTAATLDRNSLTGTVAMRYKLTSMTTAVASADVIEDQFRLAAPGLDTTRSYRYLGGLEFGKTALVNGRFLAGVRDFPASSAGALPAYSGLAMQGQVSWPILTRLRLIGTALRDVYVSSVPVSSVEERGRNTYVLTALLGGAEVDLPLSLVGRGTFGFDEAKYLLPTIVQGIPFDRVEHLYTVTAALLRRFSDNVRVGGQVTYYRRVSTIPLQSYDRWLYGLSAEVVP
ncbi:MAG TPA: outer membrane beta-barrel protein [Vicinamibacteria bacterium]|nr:outer membrane beta-barrel protein [Vicinamibacteria bacterium]